MNDKKILERCHNDLTAPNSAAMNDDNQYLWARSYAESSIDDQTSQSSQQEEIRRLKAELRRVTEERDILKMVTALVYA